MKQISDMFANMDEPIGEDIDLDVDDLFKDPEDSQLPNDDDDDAADDNKNMTETMRKRINTVRAKAEADAQAKLEKAAKAQGFASYAEMEKAAEKKLIEDSGFDPNDVEGVIEKLLEKRLADDPRLKKLAEYEERDKNNFVKSELDSINKLTGTKLKTLDDVPPEALALWEKGVPLKQAYMATMGETIITKGLAAAQAGSFKHLADTGSGGTTKVRGLTEEEKDIYRSVIPGITEEELSKKTTSIK